MHPREGLRRAVARYVVVVLVLVALAVPAFLGMVALGSGLILNMAYDKVAIRLKDKMGLAARHSEPRILAFGGSNTFFDFRGADIEALTGLPAINIGSHSSNGLRFLLWQAETTAKAGDIVILPLEDAYYGNPGITFYGANVSLALGADFFNSLPFAEKIVYLRNIHVRRLWKIVTARLGVDYELEKDWTYPINPNGDMEAPEPSPVLVSVMISEESGKKPKNFDFVPPAAEEIADFVERMEAKGVRVLFSLPGVIENIEPTEKQVAALRRSLKAAGARFLDLPERGAIPAEMMFDTVYHASTPGARLYSAQMADALCKRARKLDITCNEDLLADARALRRGAARRSYLFAAPEALASLQPDGDGTPVRLEPETTTQFMVAALRNCRNRIEISAEGTGSLDVAVAGKRLEPIKLTGKPAAASRPVQAGPGLVAVELTASSGSEIALSGVKRVSSCR